MVCRRHYRQANSINNTRTTKNFNSAGGGAPPKNLFCAKATRRSNKSTYEV